MRGIVLAAGRAQRLHPLTASLPKTLVPLSDERTILDLVLSNLRSVGIDEIAIVTGFGTERIERRVPDLERRHGVSLELLFNDRAEEWNNAYSLWLARAAFDTGAVIVNGDTVHPVSVEETLLAARSPELLLAVDRRKVLGEEEMKVLLTEGDCVRRISKDIVPATAAGEYIGVALVESSAAGPLAEALEVTWRRDPSLYYEDGFQELVERGSNVGAAAIGEVEWVEVDDHADLARARDLERHS